MALPHRGSHRGGGDGFADALSGLTQGRHRAGARPGPPDRRHAGSPRAHERGRGRGASPWRLRPPPHASHDAHGRASTPGTSATSPGPRGRARRKPLHAREHGLAARAPSRGGRARRWSRPRRGRPKQRAEHGDARRPDVHVVPAISRGV